MRNIVEGGEGDLARHLYSWDGFCAGCYYRGTHASRGGEGEDPDIGGRERQREALELHGYMGDALKGRALFSSY